MRYRFVSIRILPAMAFLAMVGLSTVLADENKPVERPRGMGHYVNHADSFPRLVFGDGLISLNDRCIVRKTKLNPKMPPVYVNGRPVGFC
jgi:hypothetical protein